MYPFVVQVDILQSPVAHLTKNHDHFRESKSRFKSNYADYNSMLFPTVYGVYGYSQISGEIVKFMADSEAKHVNEPNVKWVSCLFLMFPRALTAASDTITIYEGILSALLWV